MKEIIIQDTEHAEQFKVLRMPGYITNLNRINLFIGTNNSGKSRFIRSVFVKLVSGEGKLRFVESEGIDKVWNQFNSKIRPQITSFLEATLREYSLLDEYRPDILIDNIKGRTQQENYLDSYLEIANFLKKILDQSPTLRSRISQSESRLRATNHQAQGHLESIINLINSAVAVKPKVAKCFYLPVLRGLRPFLNAGQNSPLASRIADVSE